MQNNVAFFDFCETLVDFQTADAFVDFVRRKDSNVWMNSLERIQLLLRRIHVIQVLEILTKHKYSLNKRFKLLQLRYKKRDELEDLAKRYYEDEIKPHFISKLLSILEAEQLAGSKVCLISGGYNLYLKYFVEEYHIDHLISTRIQFRNNTCTGMFDGLDCLRENKILLLNMFYHNKNEFQSRSYSDSISDLPLLKWTNEGYGISRRESQEWISKNNLKEIIW